MLSYTAPLGKPAKLLAAHGPVDPLAIWSGLFLERTLDCTMVRGARLNQDAIDVEKTWSSGKGEGAGA